MMTVFEIANFRERTVFNAVHQTASADLSTCFLFYCTTIVIHGSSISSLAVLSKFFPSRKNTFNLLHQSLCSLLELTILTDYFCVMVVLFSHQSPELTCTLTSDPTSSPIPWVWIFRGHFFLLTQNLHCRPLFASQYTWDLASTRSSFSIMQYDIKHILFAIEVIIGLVMVGLSLCWHMNVGDLCSFSLIQIYIRSVLVI